MELETTRPFAAGAFRFTVAASGADRQLIEELFVDLPQSEVSHPTDGVFVMLRVEADGDPVWMLNGPRMNDQPELSLVSALTSLMAAVNVSALDAEPESLHLHAAAATKDGRAVIIAAERNTGKTTTVAHLVERGWGFVTDETVRLPADGDEIGGFPKPLSIKPGGDRLVDHLVPWMIPSSVPEGTESFRFVPVGASGASIETTGTPQLVILLRRPEDGTSASDAVSRELHPADAVVSLMQETLDAERFGSAALRLANLAASTRCHELTIGTPEETAALIEELFVLGPVEAHSVEELSTSPTITDGVVSVAIADRMVIHHQGTGQIFALDSSASKAWEQIGGWRDHGIDLAGPVVNQFIDQLRALGVLAPPSTDAPAPDVKRAP